MVTVLYSGGLSALGIGEDTRYARYSYVGPERTYPYALMTICDVQRHLVAARVLPRSGVDGIWGPQSRNALYEFIKTMPLAVVRAVYTDNQDRGNIPPFGTREDYKQIGSTQIRIPQAYVMAFPPKANVTCRRATPTATTGGGTSPAANASATVAAGDTTGDTAAGDATTTTVTDETSPSLEEQLAASRRDEAPASGGFSPWLILAGVALGALAISASRSR